MVVKDKPYIILTGGDGGYGNLGDEWLSDATKAQYKKLTKRFNVILLMANVPEQYTDRFEYVADNLEAFMARNISIDSIAAVHYYGGGYLNSYWMKEKLWLYDYLIGVGLQRNKVFFTGVGLGPLNDAEIAKLKVIADSSAFFGTRDNCFADRVGGEFMFDESIFLIKYGFWNQFNANRIAVDYKNELWINFRIASHVGADETKIAVLLDRLKKIAKEYYLNIKYFAMIKGDGFDEKAEMERVLRLNDINDQVIDRAENYRGLLSQFKNAAGVVTTSYHATLASLYDGIPVVSIYENEYYGFKYRGLQEVLDTPLLHAVNLADYEINELHRTLDSKDRDIRARINKLKKVNRQAYKKYRDFLRVL